MLDGSNPHVKWLREAATTLRNEKRYNLAHTCEQAANEIIALAQHRDTLLQNHLDRLDRYAESSLK